MNRTAINRSSLVVIAILLLAVVSLSQTLFQGLRLDLTENQLYTLSPGTLNVLEGIQEPIQLYFFFNPEAVTGAPQLQSYASRVQEMLEELSLRAGDRLQLQMIAPEPFSTDEDRAVELGVRSVQIGDGADRLYFGLAGTNALDDVQTIGFFDPAREDLLEYELAKLIYGLAHPNKPKVGLISSLPVSGSFDPASRQPIPGWTSISQLDEFFEVRTLDANGLNIEPDIQLLLLIHPTELPESALYAIDQFVLRGGRALVFVDPIAEAARAQPPGGPGAPPPTLASSLDPLFAAWGVRLRENEILGDAGSALQVQTPFDQRPTYHLGMLGLEADRLNRDDIVTQDLERIHLGFSGMLEAVPGAGTEFQPLLSSSDKAAPIAAFRIQPNTPPGSLLNGFMPTGERYAAAVRLRGPARSAYGEAAPDGTPGEAHLSASTDEINVIVVADTDLLTDRLWVRTQNVFGQRVATPFASNGDFLINSVDNLLGSSDLIGIKARAGYRRPFTRVEEMKREADARFREHEQALQEKLRETERKINEMRSAKVEGNVLVLSDEQRQELGKFQDQQLRTRQELREVRHSLNKDIDRLESVLKFVNIGLVPLLIVLIATGAAVFRRYARGVR